MTWPGQIPRHRGDTRAAADEAGLRPKLHSLFEPIAEFLVGGMQVTQVFSVRLDILTLAMPVVLLFSLVALVDGFVKRDLRGWVRCRESSFVYHWAKQSAMPLLVLSGVIYLALPFPSSAASENDLAALCRFEPFGPDLL